MRLVLAVLLICLNVWAEDNGLPFESELTKLKVNKISNGNTLILNYHLSIPETQKVNPGAPSHVSVYEKQKNEKIWTLTRKINLAGISSMLNNFDLLEKVNLKSSDSEIMLHSTIYHCGKKDTKIPCFIQGFQGLVTRDKKLKNQTAVNFKVKATVY